MKRVLSILVAAMVVFAFTTPAMAYFGEGTFFGSVYEINPDTGAASKEGALHLGSVGDFNTAVDQIDIFAANSIDATLWGGATTDSMNNADAAVYGAYDYGYDSVSGLGTVRVLIGSTKADGISVNSNFNFLKNPLFQVQSKYSTQADAATETLLDNVDNTSGGSYHTSMNLSSTVNTGIFANYLAGTASGTGQVDLNDTADAVLYLYDFLIDYKAFTPTAKVYYDPNGGIGDYVGRMIFAADGSVDYLTESSSAVPAPAALWLLGSGLMGLVGIRRKNA